MNQAPKNRTRSGVSLVELMVSMLLLIIVFLGWMRMNSIQAVRKESLRYAAVEKAAGYLDALDNRLGLYEGGRFYWKFDDGEPALASLKKGKVAPLWTQRECGSTSVPTFGYQLVVEQGLPHASFQNSAYWNNGVWVRADLFESADADPSRQRPFTYLRMFVQGVGD